MTVHQTKIAQGRVQQATDYQHGTKCVAVMEHTFTAAFTAATDVLELGLVPAGARIVGATIIGTGLAALTADVGILDGTVGAKDEDRDLTTDLLFDAESVADAEASATMAECLALTPVQAHRALGLKLSGDVAAAPTPSPWCSNTSSEH